MFNLMNTVQSPNKCISILTEPGKDMNMCVDTLFIGFRITVASFLNTYMVLQIRKHISPFG